MCAWSLKLLLLLSLIATQCSAIECPLPVKVDNENGHYVTFADRKLYLGRNGIYETTFQWNDCIIDVDLQPFVEGVGDTHRHCTKMCRKSYPELADDQWDEYVKLRIEEANWRSGNGISERPPQSF
ncbi:hypothetical protein AAHC03_010016 [Spirometra sp. Aus1]